MNNYQDGLMRINNNMQAASFFLGQAIRGAGHYGCTPLTQEAILSADPSLPIEQLGLNRQTAVSTLTYEALAKNTLVNQSVLSRVDPESDILWLRGVYQFYAIADFEAGVDNTVFMIGQPNFKHRDILVLSDCQSIDILEVAQEAAIFSNDRAKIHFRVPTQQQGLSKLYPPSAKIGKLSSQLIYVGYTGRSNQANQAIKGLYVTDLNGRTLELIEGVERLEVKLCCEKDSRDAINRDNDQAQPIQSVRLNILLDSVEEALLEPKSYKVGQRVVQAPDKKMRKWWSEEWTVRQQA